jgi:DNA-binding MarR family transcriptional regulator
MGPANNLIYFLSHLASVMNRQADQLLQEQLGIGLSQYRVLMVLEWNPRISQRVISDSLGQSESGVSRQIRLLIKKGMLSAKRDPFNRRQQITVPTPLGARITEAAGNLLKRSLKTDLGGLDDKQATSLNKALEQLHKELCKPGKTGACKHMLGI